MAEQSRPNYYAVIPAEVRYADINANSKLLFGEITALCNKEGYCWASNAYLAELYHVQPRQISRWISELSNNAFIEVELEPSAKGVLRKINIITDPLVNPGISKLRATRQKRRGGIDKKDVGNNTSINNKSINTLTSDSSKELAKRLADHITKRHPALASKVSKTSIKWDLPIDRLHRIDGYGWEDIERHIDWVFEVDNFWYKVILSGDNLRKNFAKIVAKADLGEQKSPITEEEIDAIRKRQEEEAVYA